MKRKATKKRVKVYDKEGLTLLGQQIKKLRAERGMTQEDLAYKSGLALSQIARIETVQANPTISTLFTIARCMEIEPRQLFDFKMA